MSLVKAKKFSREEVEAQRFSREVYNSLNKSNKKWVNLPRRKRATFMSRVYPLLMDIVNNSPYAKANPDKFSQLNTSQKARIYMDMNQKILHGIEYDRSQHSTSTDPELEALDTFFAGETIPPATDPETDITVDPDDAPIFQTGGGFAPTGESNFQSVVSGDEDDWGDGDPDEVNDGRRQQTAHKTGFKYGNNDENPNQSWAGVRGQGFGAGGQELEAEVTSDPNGSGDRITAGPPAVETASKLLRTAFRIAGYDSVLNAIDQNNPLQSSAIFNSFSWIPEGFGNGPNNQLFLRNKQLGLIRYGIEPLMQPRQEQFINCPHPIPYAYRDSKSIKEIEGDFIHIMRTDFEEGNLQYKAKATPVYVLDGMYNKMPSSQGLPRSRGVNTTKPVVQNHTPFKLVNQKCGAKRKLVWRNTENTTYGNLV